MKRYSIIILFALILFSIIGTLGFVKYKNENKENAIQDVKNNVFTKDLYNNLVEIDYWYGDNKIVINKPKDIDRIYNEFASLELTKFSHTLSDIKYGHQIVDLITTNGMIGLGLLSDEINFDGECYHTNKNIIPTVREIALKYNNE